MKGVTLTLRQGIDSGYAWELVDTDGNPADLTGWTARSQIRTHQDPTATLLHELTAEVDVPGSRVTVSWTAEESLGWEWRSGFFDVILTDPVGRPVQIVTQGRVEVDKVVTTNA